MKFNKIVISVILLIAMAVPVSANASTRVAAEYRFDGNWITGYVLKVKSTGFGDVDYIHAYACSYLSNGGSNANMASKGTIRSGYRLTGDSLSVQTKAGFGKKQGNISCTARYYNTVSNIYYSV